MASKLSEVQGGEGVYDELGAASVGFVNPTYMNLADPYSAYYQKTPIGLPANDLPPSDFRTPPEVVPQRTHPTSDNEARKWKVALVVTVIVAILIIAGLVVALVFLVRKECTPEGTSSFSSGVDGANYPVVNSGQSQVGGNVVKDGPKSTTDKSKQEITKPTITTSTPTPTPKPNLKHEKPKAPKSAIPLMGCHPPMGKDDAGSINDLCWLDDETLMAVQYLGHQVFKMVIDIKSKTCNISVLDTGYKARRVSCSQKGDVYVSSPLEGYIKIYHKDGGVSRWNVTGVAVPRNVAVWDPLMVVDHNGTSPFSVFNMDHEFLQEISVDGDEHEILYTHLTPNKVLLATGHFTHKLYIHNITANTTVTTGGYGTIDGLFNSPGDLCDTPGGFILVCDWMNHRISVMTPDGIFLHHLDIKNAPIHQPNAIAVLPRKNQPSLMALAPFPHPVIWIYALN